MGFWESSWKRVCPSPFLFAYWNGDVMAGVLPSTWVLEDEGPAQGLCSRRLDRVGSPRTL